MCLKENDPILIGVITNAAKALCLVLLLAIVGCTESREKEVIPKSHPAYSFHQIARRGPTTVGVCEAHGGREIYPNDYEVLEILDQGVVTLREKSTGKKFLGVSFGEGEGLVTLCTCCWELNPEDSL